jgi:hypothetical protein
METWKRMKREKVRGTLAYVFYEFHKLKSSDHQTAQLEIKIKNIRMFLSVTRAAWRMQIRVANCWLTFFLLRRDKLIIFVALWEKDWLLTCLSVANTMELAVSSIF